MGEISSDRKHAPPARRRVTRAPVVIAASIVIASLGPSAAGAAINVYQSSEAAPLLGEVRKASCKLKRVGNRRVFHAGGTTTNGAYTLDVDIFEFRGFKRTYYVPYGAANPTVNFEGVSNGADYSNNFPFPGQPPPAAGAIEFRNDGAKLRLGIYALPNQDYSQGVALAGGMKCRYRR